MFVLSRATVTVHGHRVDYQIVGSGEPVVLVHGLAGSVRWWQRNVAALAESHAVYLVNLPGFGTFRRGGPRFDLAKAADWLTTWIEAVGIAPCHIVAHSMGGHVAIRVAARRPDLVRRLVLIAPALVAGRRRLRSYPLALIPAGRAAPLTFLPILALDTLPAGPLTLLRAARSLCSHDVQAELTNVTAPTLLVWGDRDALVPASWAPAIRDGLPGARLMILPGAGHVANFDRPGPFNAATLAFLAGAEPPGERSE